MTNNNASALPTPSDLDECAAMTVADALKIILANSYAIYLKTKNFHWHVSGPYFRDYHLLLDEQAAEILAVTDAIAERARKTGNTTIRSIGDIARHQTINHVAASIRFIKALELKIKQKAEAAKKASWEDDEVPF